MSESIHDIAVRMSGDECNHRCADCPANKLRDKGPCVVYVFAQAKNADEQLEALKKWASEHPLPKKTWLNMFRESFPNAPRRGDGAPQTCPEALYGSVAENRGCTNGCYDGDCFDCWNREVEE